MGPARDLTLQWFLENLSSAGVGNGQQNPGASGIAEVLKDWDEPGERPQG